MTKLLLDNSFLWWYRKPNVTDQNNKFLEKLLNDFSINLESVFLTERSFIEVIGKGKISDELEIPHLLKKEKQEIQEELRNNKPIDEVKITKFIDNLEEKIQEKLKEGLSSKIISKTTLDNLRSNPFADVLKTFENKVIAYAQNLEKEEIYNDFVKVLTVDSTIRFVLDIVNLFNIAPQKNNSALGCIDIILKAIISKYRNSGIFTDNLILIMSGLKIHAEARLNRDKAKKKHLIRIFDDRADGELAYYPLAGKSTDGMKDPVTVFLSEKQKTVEERLKYNFKGMGEIAIYTPIKLLFGRIINFNFVNLSYEETLTATFIDKQFRDSSGERFILQTSADCFN